MSGKQFPTLTRTCGETIRSKRDFFEARTRLKLLAILPLVIFSSASDAQRILMRPREKLIGHWMNLHGTKHTYISTSAITYWDKTEPDIAEAIVKFKYVIVDESIMSQTIKLDLFDGSDVLHKSKKNVYLSTSIDGNTLIDENSKARGMAKESHTHVYVDAKTSPP